MSWPPPGTTPIWRNLFGAGILLVRHGSSFIWPQVAKIARAHGFVPNTLGYKRVTRKDLSQTEVMQPSMNVDMVGELRPIRLRLKVHHRIMLRQIECPAQSVEEIRTI